jgi:hypothetical protein
VPITDFVLQPFEPELEWGSFSVPVLEADVPVMHEILARISGDKLKGMQVRGGERESGRERQRGRDGEGEMEWERWRGRQGDRERGGLC